ncbi:hypothetical protein GBA52_001742 [Prunus armeniaca]|nr:hypothetical protein GBA52_001742 [Prunus armeniaca]
MGEYSFFLLFPSFFLFNLQELPEELLQRLQRLQELPPFFYHLHLIQASVFRLHLR